MGSNIRYSVTRGVVSTGASSPLSGSYYIAGSLDTLVDTVLSAGTNQLVAASFGPAGGSAGNLQAIEIYSPQNCTLTTNGTGGADVQTITTTGTPTGGTFVLGFKGALTAPIAYNAPAATIQSALQALATIGSGNVTCTGGALPAGVVCTFAGTLATGLQPIMVAGQGGLTGGSSPAVVVTHTTSGTPQDTIAITANIPILWDISSIEACPFAAAVSAWYLTNAVTLRLQARILTF